MGLRPTQRDENPGEAPVYAGMRRGTVEVAYALDELRPSRRLARNVRFEPRNVSLLLPPQREGW